MGGLFYTSLKCNLSFHITFVKFELTTVTITINAGDEDKCMDHILCYSTPDVEVVILYYSTVCAEEVISLRGPIQRLPVIHACRNRRQLFTHILSRLI
jgi:hypothetical protein